MHIERSQNPHQPATCKYFTRKLSRLVMLQNWNGINNTVPAGCILDKWEGVAPVCGSVGGNIWLDCNV